MVVKKMNIISIALLIGLAFAPVSYADEINNLVQLDLKKSSSDSVDVTLFTSNNYGDNVMVRKKSDNKYVILVPKVQSSGFSASNLNGVKDLVSNVDVKTINDTSGGYTKVTLITTKPLDIKTRTQKSAPVTAEQKEYQTLIAQANAIKNNIAKQNEITKPKEQKTEITVNKAVNNEIKNTVPKTDTKPIIKSKVPEIKLEEINPETLQRQTRRQHLTEMINETRNELQGIPQTLPSIADVVPVSSEIQEIEELSNSDKNIQNNSVKNSLEALLIKIKNRIPVKTFGLILLPLVCISILLKFIKASLTKSKSLKESFTINLTETPPSSDVEKYNNIVNNNGLSWKEKYQLYLDKTATPISRGENKGKYSFIKSPAKSSIVDKKREELEKLIEETSYINQQEIEPEIVESEDSYIQNSIKLKAFDNHNKSLKMSKRNMVKSRFKKFDIPVQEQNTVELGGSALHANPRSFTDANLNVADVDKNRLKYKPQEYIMSSVDEFFSILDKEEEKRPMNISASNPIAKHRVEKKSQYLKGLIVKSGFNIDKNKGFYLINQDGQNSLIGKVNDEVFVLKNFDSNVTTPIQVRQDNDNVYMVKAGNFKSLVEVNEDKMGVLIEL